MMRVNIIPVGVCAPATSSEVVSIGISRPPTGLGHIESKAIPPMASPASIVVIKEKTPVTGLIVPKSSTEKPPPP